MKSKIQLLFMVCVLAVMSLNVTASVFESNYTTGYIKKVVMRSVVDCSGYYTAFTCEHYLNYGESMSYEDFVSYNGEVTCYYTFTLDSITWIPVGGSGGDVSLDPPVMDEPGPLFGDDTHDHEVILSQTIEPDPKTAEYGKAKVTLSVELREVVTGQSLGSEPDLSGNTMPANNGGRHQYRGAGEINSGTIEIEPVPGQQNIYRGIARHIQLKSIVWYNKNRYPGPKPTLATMHAEYQHYSEYAKRLDALAEELNEILDRHRGGTPNSVRNDIKRDMINALNRFQVAGSTASVRYDSQYTDPADLDVGTHHGDLGRKVRVPENFTIFPSLWPTP